MKCVLHHVIARYEAIAQRQVTTFVVLNLHRRALGRARASYFCRHKNQKGLQQKGFFAHNPSSKPTSRPLPCKTNRTTGCNYFAQVRAHPLLLQKLAMPLQPHTPYMFCSFSPEADLLRKTFGKQDIFVFVRWYNIKKGFAS